MNIEPEIILDQIEEYFRKHDGECKLTTKELTEFFAQVTEVCEFMNFPGNRNLLISHLVYLAIQEQTIKNGH